MKIDPLRPKGQLFQQRSEQTKGGRARVEQNEFSAELAQNKEELSLQELKRLFNKVTEQGNRLTQTPTFEELKSYRDLVQRFIKEAVGKMYDRKSQSGWDRMGRRKVYTIVTKVNSTLEDMAEEIRTGQATALSIAAKHDAVRGMLVDLYM